MKELLRKEMKLPTLIITYLFIGFSFMTMIPGYPILCGVFFVTLGLYHSYANAREAGDIIYSVLLPIAKRHVVKAKYLFVLFIEALSFILMLVLTLLRMTVFSNSSIYLQNALMTANFFYLSVVLIIFSLFNLVFVGGFFKTAYKMGFPFVVYCIVAFVVIGLAEALHHVPGLESLNTIGFENLGLQTALLVVGVLIFVILTTASYKKACVNFENTDL